jgi:uncharacterized protein YbaP (TraB family)
LKIIRKSKILLYTGAIYNGLKKIEEEMAEGKNIFIIVGAGRLIGPGSIVAPLKQKGYRVKQQ